LISSDSIGGTFEFITLIDPPMTTSNLFSPGMIGVGGGTGSICVGRWEMSALADFAVLADFEAFPDFPLPL
jgi:hypothetical protein